MIKKKVMESLLGRGGENKSLVREYNVSRVENIIYDQCSEEQLLICKGFSPVARIYFVRILK